MLTAQSIRFPFTHAEEPNATRPQGHVIGVQRTILRLEGGLVLLSAVVAYAATSSNWSLFLLLFFLPDVSMLGYLVNKRFGAIAYNIAHTYLSAAIVGGVGLILALPLLKGIGLIWVAHIGFDRLFGYGLKYATGFKRTHLNAA